MKIVSIGSKVYRITNAEYETIENIEVDSYGGSEELNQMFSTIEKTHPIVFYLDQMYNYS